MNPDNIINGTSKMVPLISFHTIVDIDVGLIRLINTEYLNKEVFEESFFKRRLWDIIKDLYHRKESNPIFLFAKDINNREILDQYYKEFLELRLDDILDRSVTTEMINLISYFNESSEINPVILYYNDNQKRILEDLSILDKNQKISLEDAKRNKESFSQFYFKLVEEAEPFSKILAKTFYFSTHALNLSEDNNDIKDSAIIDDIIKVGNAISFFDLYRKDLLKGEQ